MATLDDINLLKTKTGLSTELVALESRLRRVSTIAIGALIILGVIVWGIFLFLGNEYGRLIKQEEVLRTSIAGQASKENLYVTVKERLPLLDKAIAAQKPWAQALDSVTAFVVPPQLASLALEDNGTIVVSINAASIEETLSYVDRVVDLTVEKRIRNPQLASLQMDKDGGVQLVLSFVPGFSL